MRLSGIEKYLGGADNVNVMELIRGEQISLPAVIRDSDMAPMNITGWTISNEVHYLRGDVTVTSGRGGTDSATITNWTMPTGEDSDIAVTSTITAAASGAFRTDLPAALDFRTLTPDANTNVPLVVVTTSFDDNGSPATIRKSRLVIVSRFG